MPGSNDAAEETKWDVRSSPRLNSRIAVAVEWSDGRETLHKEGYTVNVGRSGCLLVIPQDLRVEQRVRITNLANKQSLEAVIAWKGEQGPNGWELGVQLINTGIDFWGLEL